MDDIQEIKADVKELLQRSAVHNEILRTHEARSLALQAGQDKIDTRLEPIEKHVNLVNVLSKLAAAILAGVAIQALIHFLIK